MPVVLCFWAWIFIHITKTQVYKRILYALFIITIVSMLIHLGTIPIMHEASTLNPLLLSIFGIICVLIYFLSLIQKPDTKSIFFEFGFWVSSAVLLWSVVFIFRTGSMYYLEHSAPDYMNWIMTLFSTTNIITYVLYLIGLLCLFPRKFLSRTRLLL